MLFTSSVDKKIFLGFRSGIFRRWNVHPAALLLCFFLLCVCHCLTSLLCFIHGFIFLLQCAVVILHVVPLTIMPLHRSVSLNAASSSHHPPFVRRKQSFFDPLSPYISLGLPKIKCTRSSSEIGFFCFMDVPLMRS